ncbi:uncharacterized protein LOC142938183 isoform X1 [Anarhichas minor]|uniref:uncharacterized protein LOC142938183 isoform X1 n=1 Tax=Anarhichas minor TaxID=65739 RepID=UPI003F734489
MSVTFSSKSGEVGEDSLNLMTSDNRPKYGWRSHISVWWIGAAAVGFLLLILILGVVAHNSRAIGDHQDSKFENLIYSLTIDKDTLRDERDQLKINSGNLTKEMEVLQSQYNAMAESRDKLQEEVNELNLNRTVCRAIGDHLDLKCENLIYNLTIDKDTLSDERDQLKINSGNLTKEMEVLQSQYNAMAESRDKLQEEVNGLNLNRTDQPCHKGWELFRDKCYFFSPNGVTKTWESSRNYCKEKGADLMIITTKEELDFVIRTIEITWIGLFDNEQEGKWKWVDGTDLLSDEFWQKGEPNDHGDNEDCAEVSRSTMKFNDAPCTRKFSWACEK